MKEKYTAMPKTMKRNNLSQLIQKEDFPKPLLIQLFSGRRLPRGRRLGGPSWEAF